MAWCIMKLDLDIVKQNIYKGCVIVEGHIESAAVNSECNCLIARVRHNCACCQLDQPPAVQWTLVVTSQHIDILMQGMHTHLQIPTYTHPQKCILAHNYAYIETHVYRSNRIHTSIYTIVLYIIDLHIYIIYSSLSISHPNTEDYEKHGYNKNYIEI